MANTDLVNEGLLADYHDELMKTHLAGGVVFDISAYNLTNGQPTPYADLAAAIGTNGANIPEPLRKGGMSVKFVQSSDHNYVQFRYMSSSTAVADFTNVDNWQGIDDAVIKDSKNLVTGGAIYNALMNIVVINATANKGNISEDAVITVKVEGETIATETGSVSLVIEYGKEFSVECSRIYDYITPEPQTFTAGPSIQKIFCNYTYIERDTITLDQTETDEESMITGDVQGDVIKAIRAASHLYLGTPLQDGSELTCQLSDIDGTKYFDGTNAALDGTEGDQWMKLPVFWWKRTAIGTAAEDGSHDSYSFSFAIAGEPDPSWHKWEGAKNLLGAKEMTVINGVGHSISGGQSTGSLTKAQFETAAAARSAGSTCVTWEWQWMMCTLFYAWYGRTNSQKQCGTGSNSYTRTLGTKDALGMTDTTNSNGNSDNTKFWGIENWWGCKAEWIGRVTSNNYVLTILDMNTGQSRTVSGFIQCGGTGGWTSRMKITEDMDYIPVAKSGTDTTSYCDWVNSNSGSRVVFRSGDSASTLGGVACVGTNGAPSGAHAHIGSRLAFNGVITEAESVAAYKAALPVGQ